MRWFRIACIPRRRPPRSRKLEMARHGLFSRAPIRKTTKSPSISAAYRPRWIWAMGAPPSRGRPSVRARVMLCGVRRRPPAPPTRFPPRASSTGAPPAQGQVAVALGHRAASRPPRSGPRLALRAARVALVPGEEPVAVRPGQLVGRHRVLIGALVEAIGAEDDLARVRQLLDDQAAGPVRPGQSLARYEAAAVDNQQRGLVQVAVGGVLVEADHHELGVPETEQAGRVAEGRLAGAL